MKNNDLGVGLIYFIILTRNIIPYLFLFKWKEPKRKSIIIAIVGMITIVSIYLAIYYLMNIRSYSSSFFIVTIPSIILLYKLSVYKDGRFLLTFSMVDTIFAIIIFGISVFAKILGINIFITIVSLVIVLAVVYLKLNQFSKYYHKMLETFNKGWGAIAIVSFIYYIMFYAIAYYPIPITDRLEYTPVIIGYFILVILSYRVILKVIELTKKVYEGNENEKILSTELEIKEKKIEMQKLYYKMAYTDSLTLLKNRRAYEEKLEEIRKRDEFNFNKVCYISFDLNNLKYVNDNEGHHRGDFLIKAMADELKESFINCENIFRIGGDEFVVILEGDLTEDEVEEILEKFMVRLQVRSKLSNMEITSAWGYTFIKDFKVDTIDNACIYADEKMYIMKRNMKDISIT